MKCPGWRSGEWCIGVDASGVGVGVAPPEAVAAGNIRAQFRWKHSSHYPCNFVVSFFQSPGTPQWRFSMPQLEFLPAAGWRAAVSGKPCWPTGDGVHISHPVGRRFVFHWNSCCVLCQIHIFRNNICELSWFFNAVIIQPKTIHFVKAVIHLTAWNNFEMFCWNHFLSCISISCFSECLFFIRTW